MNWLPNQRPKLSCWVRRADSSNSCEAAEAQLQGRRAGHLRRDPGIAEDAVDVAVQALDVADDAGRGARQGSPALRRSAPLPRRHDRSRINPAHEPPPGFSPTQKLMILTQALQADQGGGKAFSVKIFASPVKQPRPPASSLPKCADAPSSSVATGNEIMRRGWNERNLDPRAVAAGGRPRGGSGAAALGPRRRSAQDDQSFGEHHLSGDAREWRAAGHPARASRGLSQRQRHQERARLDARVAGGRRTC